MLQPFYDALIHPNMQSPTDVMVWNGSDPLVRFAVYRNNVMASLIDALADNYPLLQAQVGEDFFRAMAAEFVRQSPPSSPILAYYGENLASWIAAFPPLADWPWLADLASLEFSFIISLHAADSQPDKEINTDAFDPQTAGLILDTSLNVVCSSYAIYKIWNAHKTDIPLSGIDPCQAESVMLFRQDNYVVVRAISSGQAQFIIALLTGATLMASVEAGQQYENEFDPEKILTELQQFGLIINLRENIL